MTEAQLKWWGWGQEGRRAALPDRALQMLRSELGEAEPSPRVELEDVVMPEARPLPAAVREAAGEGAILTAHEQRVRRAAGRGYPDLVRLRSGRLDLAPDAIVLPDDSRRLAAILTACSEAGVAVVPFGGGTSVVGGVQPLAGRHGAVIALDLRRLRGMELDGTSMTATIGAGVRGPEAESALAAAGFTLGHFPQSFEQATIGGYAATRSAGQASSGYGRFDELVTSIRMTTPGGEVRTLESPHTAAGPSIRELVLGSEGTLGVISSVTARIRSAPAERRYDGFIVADFRTGVEALRELAQRRALPDVARLSDEEETRVSMAMAATGGGTRRALGAYLRLRRREGGCMVIAGWEGERESVERRRAASARILGSAGAVALGSRPGRAWEHGRYAGPYLRDELMDRGYLIETLETGHSYSRLAKLYEAVGGALRNALASGGTPPIVMCHVSHVYADGASLYFTFIARARPGDEIAQWGEAKAAACEAIVATGGTITHHHAVGTDHAPYMQAEVGSLGLEALRALKDTLDPAGVMNPGKLLP